MREVPAYVPPPAAHLKSVFIDAEIIVADKPAGLLSVPGLGPGKDICAQHLLAERHGPVFTVHRLDMDTSGLIVFGRTKMAQRHLSKYFQERRIEKLYEAIVDGLIEEDHGTIDLPIAKFSLQRPLRHIAPDGQRAITHWRVIDRGHNQTRLQLVPETGRSHQLRLHLSAIGHPILGDPFYGDPNRAERLLLHATALSFPHPENLKRQQFKAQAPF